MEQLENSVMAVKSANMINDVEQIKLSIYNRTCVLIFICSGSLTFRCMQNEHIGKTGDVLVYNNSEFEIAYLHNDPYFSAYLIILNELMATPTTKNRDLREIMPLVKSNGKEECVSALRWNFKYLYNEIVCKHNGYDDVAHNHVAIIFSLLNRYVHSSSYSTLAEVRNKDVCQSIKDYLDKNYWHDINIECLADDFFISYNYLSRLFKRRIGYSPINYLIMVRMGMAKMLLVTTDLSIQDIAGQIGYENGNYFSIVFKKQIGVSPTKFRLSSKRQV